MSYGAEIRQQFARAYARMGNAAHALKAVLGEERAAKMQPHTLRARASELLNNVRTVELIEQAKAEMTARGEPLPHYRQSTWRADLFSEEEEKDPLVKPHIAIREQDERSSHFTATFGTHAAKIARLEKRLFKQAKDRLGSR